MFFVLLPLVSAQASAQCISLAQSTNCKEFADYSIQTFPTVQSVSEFDTYIQNQSAFNYGTMCPQWATAKGTPIRYSTSMACAFAVFSSTARGVCNQDKPKPKLLCKSSLNLMVNDIQTQLNKSCPGASVFLGYQQYISQTVDNQCLLAVGPDVAKKCGFEDAGKATEFCNANGSQLCCTSTVNEIGAADKAVSTAGSAGSAPTTPSTTSNSNTGPSGVNPLFVAAAAVGVSLIIILASGLFLWSRKKTAPAPMPFQKPIQREEPREEPKETYPNAYENVYQNQPYNPTTFSDFPQDNYESGFRDSFANDFPQNPNTLSIPPPPEPIRDENTMEVVFEYEANLFDELTLNVGDEVEIHDKFDDGWALGYNLTTGKQGTFPLACLAPFGTASEYRSSKYSSGVPSKRMSSMYSDMQRYSMTSSNFQ